MQEEINALHANNIWGSYELSKARTIVLIKWQNKVERSDAQPKYKAFLVVN